MPKKSLSYSFLAKIGACLLIGGALFGTLAYAQTSTSDVAFELQLSDWSCTGNFGNIKSTGSINQTAFGQTNSTYFAGAAPSSGAPDCKRIKLKISGSGPVVIDRDFRLGMRAADHASFDANNNVIGVSQVGPVNWTPWASEGGGWSGWATDTNGYDPDVNELIIETRAAPINTIFNDVRVWLQAADHYGSRKSSTGCDGQFGAIVKTPWASEGSGWSDWSQDAKHGSPNCHRVYLEVKKGTPPATVGDRCVRQEKSETIWFASDGSEKYGDSIPYSSVVTISPYKSWNVFGDASWISYANTNWKGSGPAYNTLVTFVKNITIPQNAVVTDATIDVLADDIVTSFKVNGTTVALPQHGEGVPPGNAAVSNTTTIPSNLLKAGANELRFTVRQTLKASVFGISFRGKIPVTTATEVTDTSCNTCVVGGGKVVTAPNGSANLANSVLSCPAGNVFYTLIAGDTTTSGGKTYIAGGTCAQTSGVFKSTPSVQAVASGVKNIRKIACSGNSVLVSLTTGGGTASPQGACQAVNGILQNYEDIDLATYYQRARTGDDSVIKILNDLKKPTVLRGVTYQNNLPTTLHVAKLWLAPDCCSAAGALDGTVVSNNSAKVRIMNGSTLLAEKGVGTTKPTATAPDPIAGTSWISADTRGVSGITGSTKFTYYKTFEIPGNAVISSASLTFRAMTGVLIQINGTPIFNNSVSLSDEPRTVTVPVSTIKKGSTNKIELITGMATVSGSFGAGSSIAGAVDFKLTINGTAPVAGADTNSGLCPRVAFQDGAANITRFVAANNKPGAVMTGTKAGISASALVSDNPAVFLKLPVDQTTGVTQLTAYVTDLPGQELFATCQFTIGGSSCTASNFTAVPASNCSGGVCTLPSIKVTGGNMTSVVVLYPPAAVVPPPANCTDGIDNDNDDAIDAADSDCTTVNDIPASPSGENTPRTTAQCTLTATPATIVLNIGSSNLAWNCTSGPVTIEALNNSGFAAVEKPDASGSINVAPDKTTTFRVTGGGASAQATVTVGGSIIDETGGF